MIQTNIDYLLTNFAILVWWIFGIYAALLFVVTLRNSGVVVALVRLVSFQVLIPLLLAIGVQLLSLSLVFVPPQQVGIVVSIISPGGIRPQPLRSGLHWLVPLLENEVSYPIYWQTYTMSSNPAEGNILGDDSIRARTSDGQEVRLDSSLIFRVDQEQAVSLHIDWQNRYTEDFVRPLMQGLVRRQVSQFTVAEVNSSARADLEAMLQRLFREEMADKGLIVDQFLLRDIAFTSQYANAVEEKQVAQEGQVQAEYEAEQIRNLARGQADAIEIEAAAQANALSMIGASLSENRDLITYEYVQKLSPNIRVLLVPNTSPLILPLDDLVPDLAQSESLSDTLPMTPTLEIEPPEGTSSSNN
jgi:regulator of protease activity HflC (stomatin/prohibitin superfamily)